MSNDREEVDGGQRGRPGRRSVEEKRDAVLELMAGKATVDQLARRYGVKPETVEKWREHAMSGVEEALRRGKKSKRERALEHEVGELRAVVTDLSIDRELLKREVDKLKAGPTRRGRSRK